MRGDTSTLFRRNVKFKMREEGPSGRGFLGTAMRPQIPDRDSSSSADKYIIVITHGFPDMQQVAGENHTIMLLPSGTIN